jgi:RNA polymerase sigma-70 factor (ECF subfamily)
MDPEDTLSSAIEAATLRFAKMVRSVGWHHGLADQDVDELMQSVRLRLWRARGSSEQIAAVPTSYVYRTARSAALDMVRSHRARREECIDTVGEGVARELDGGFSAEDRLDGQELAALVGHLVEEITPSRRPVLRMYLAGYERAEIAALMGWSEAKTRNLLYRGLADLRGLLTAQGIGPGVAT